MGDTPVPMIALASVQMRDLWRSELYRFEQVIGARLKHLEERG
jgi:hypothetical protein